MPSICRAERSLSARPCDRPPKGFASVERHEIRSVQLDFFRDAILAPLQRYKGFVKRKIIEARADCLSKDRDTHLAFYRFPAKHW